MIPVDFSDAYAELILLRDDLTDLAREHLDLAAAHEDLKFRHQLALAFLKQALPRVYGAEATVRQLQGLEPWHPDES